jgi:hypothetical protein
VQAVRQSRMFYRKVQSIHALFPFAFTFGFS